MGEPTPEDIPTPSYIDIKSIKQQIRTVNLNTTKIFLIIIGRKKSYVGLYNDNGKLIAERYISIEY